MEAFPFDSPTPGAHRKARPGAKVPPRRLVDGLPHANLTEKTKHVRIDAFPHRVLHLGGLRLHPLELVVANPERDRLRPKYDPKRYRLQ